MLINNTVFGKAPFRTTLVVVSIFLTILFTVMKPEISQNLSFFPRLLFWFLQVATGLVGIVLASLLIRQIANRDFHLTLLLFITGLVGALVASPAFVLIDTWFPGVADEPDDWLDHFATQGPMQSILVEFVDVLPPLLVTWFVVNLPLLLHTTFMHKPPMPQPPQPEEKPEDKEAAQRQQAREQLFAKLPTVIGDDIVSISSDLHYLNVTTTLGSSLILGSLTQIAEAFEDDGFLVHRSHWVHKNHVLKVHISGKNAYCLMSDDSQIPISRSKRKLVKSYFGQTSRPLADSSNTYLRKVE